jgi:hypothetical protein
MCLSVLSTGCSLTDLDGFRRSQPGGQGGQGGAGAATGATQTASGEPLNTVGYAAEVLADGPLAYWRLGERSGGVARDELGDFDADYLGDVQLGAPGALTADPNTAAELDGVSAHVVAGSVLPFLDRAHFSIEAWIKPVGGGTIASKTFTDGATAVMDGYGLMIVEAALVLFRYSGGYFDQLEAPLPAGGELSHVVGRYDGNMLSIVVNGEVVASARSERQLLPQDGAFLLGGQQGLYAAITGYYHGRLDEVAIYGHELSDQRIAVHLQAAARP